MATLPPLDVPDDDRRVLQGWLRAHTTEQRLVQRGRVVLMAAEGASNRAIAAATGLSQAAVGRWRSRYARQGLAGLRDMPRPGRPPVHGPQERLRIVATVTETPPDPDSQWTHEAIAERLADTGRMQPHGGAHPSSTITGTSSRRDCSGLPAAIAFRGGGFVGEQAQHRRVAANCCAYPSNPDPGTPTAQRSKGRRRLLRLPFKR